MANLDGLANGFLAGFQAMDGYYRGKKADERADKEMGLRDAMWQNMLDRQKVADDRYTDETAYKKERDSLSDVRYDNEIKYKHEQDNLSNKRANVMLGLQQAQNQRLQQAHDLEVRAKEKADWQSDNMPAIKVIVSKQEENLRQGRPLDYGLSRDEIAIINNKYAARFNISGVFNPEFANASRSALGKVREIVSNPDAPNWDQKKLYDAINTPEMTKSLGVMFKNDLEDGIGQRTADGSVVSGYASPRIVPTGNGMFAVEADVTYEGPDGKKFTKPAPITVGRATGGDAEVKQFSANDLIRYFGNAAKASNEANSQQLKEWSVAAGLTEGADNKGYRQAVVNLNADTQKNIDRINSDQTMSEQEKAAAVKRERDALQKQISGMGDVFGVSQGKKAPASVSDWAGGDPVKEEWLMSNKPVAEFALSRGDSLDELMSNHMAAGWKPRGFFNKDQTGGNNAGSNGGGNNNSSITPPPRKKPFKLNMPSGYEQYSSQQGESQAPGRTFMDDLADARSGLEAIGSSAKAVPNPANYAGQAWAARPTK